MELWEKLSAELDAFHERMESYESLPEEELIEKYRKEHIALSQKDNNSHHFSTNLTNEIPQIFTIDFVFN